MGDLQGISFDSLLYSNLGSEDTEKIVLLARSMPAQDKMAFCAYVFALVTHGCSAKISNAMHHLGSDSPAFIADIKDAGLWFELQIADVKNYVKSFVQHFGWQIHSWNCQERAQEFCPAEYDEIFAS